MFRHDLAFRRVTTRGRDLPRDAANIAELFIQNSNAAVAGCNKAEIYAIDETSIYLDSPLESTYEARGKKRVKAVTAGAEKSRLSVIFGASADGKKLPALVLIPRKRQLENFDVPDNVIVAYSR